MNWLAFGIYAVGTGSIAGAGMYITHRQSKKLTNYMEQTVEDEQDKLATDQANMLNQLPSDIKQEVLHSWEDSSQDNEVAQKMHSKVRAKLETLDNNCEETL